MTADGLAKAVTALGGVFYSLAGAALLVAPRWFFEVVAPFEPYNQHFMGDAGAFALALGVGLLLAARDPRRHMALIGIVVLASVLHALNHLYDDLFADRGDSLLWLTNTVPLAALAVVLGVVWWRDRRR
jgi:uncharacterized membrane protein